MTIWCAKLPFLRTEGGVDDHLVRRIAVFAHGWGGEDLLVRKIAVFAHGRGGKGGVLFEIYLFDEDLSIFDAYLRRINKNYERLH